MRTRLPVLILVVCPILLATCARAQIAKWETVGYEKWGFVLQIPSGFQKQALPNQPPDWTYDVYAARGLACVVKVTPTPGDQLAATAIEQAVQSQVKESSKLGPAKRWEQESKQGDLFKGFTAMVQLNSEDAAESAISKIVGADAAFECVSMAPLGDEISPILSVGVVGPKNRESEVIAMAKGIAAFVSEIESWPPALPVNVPKPRKLFPEIKPVSPPKPNPKPWPALKKGDIELAGVVDAISADRKSVTMIVETVKLPGQDPIELTPARPKKVMLRQKLSWIAAGQRIRILGKNTGIGKPMTADAVEQLPGSRPTNTPAFTRPSPPALPSPNPQP